MREIVLNTAKKAISGIGFDAIGRCEDASAYGFKFCRFIHIVNRWQKEFILVFNFGWLRKIHLCFLIVGDW